MGQVWDFCDWERELVGGLEKGEKGDGGNKEEKIGKIGKWIGVEWIVRNDIKDKDVDVKG